LLSLGLSGALFGRLLPRQGVFVPPVTHREAALVVLTVRIIERSWFLKNVVTQ
jgi:hypothetical protein